MSLQFRKMLHPATCTFARECRDGGARLGQRSIALGVTAAGGGMFHLSAQGPGWLERSVPVAFLPPYAGIASRWRAWITDDGWMQVADGDEILVAGRFGACGAAWLVDFDQRFGDRYLGGGARPWGLDHHGARIRFASTDVWADHPWSAVEKAEAEPLYASFPVVILRRAGRWMGICIDSGWPAFAVCGSRFEFFPAIDGGSDNHRFYVGADGGEPSLWLMAGDSLAEVVRGLQRLLGTVPVPPLWALGHHQSRWGYAGPDDLDELNRQYRQHAIPCDGLWLDIDYMRGWRVFTLDPERWQDAPGRLSALAGQGRRVVPILDPGIKREPGLLEYEEAVAGGHVCVTPEGTPYAGFVWPGETVFPDFSQAATRDWWAGRVTAFTRHGFAGYWLDMNDPATGAVDPEPMRFRQGAWPHAAFRSQYALGMAMASHAGVSAARPGQRPFLLSRSGSPGIARYAANWTGDNLANEAHLKASLALVLNLSLSGQPFSGPDVPGFGGTPDDDLAVRWYRACCLLPFLRNHSNKNDPPREPWRFSPEALAAIRAWIRLRYRLMPYLYQQWIAQEDHGDPPVRPLCYHHDDESVAACADQFLVGRDLLVAPCLCRADGGRLVVLPAGRWFDLMHGRWRASSHRVGDAWHHLPLYARDGALIATVECDPAVPVHDLSRVDLHLFLSRGRTEATYASDDGLTHAYRQGKRTSLAVRVQRIGRQGLRLDARTLTSGAGRLDLRLVDHGGARRVLVVSGDTRRRFRLRPVPWRVGAQALRGRGSGRWRAG